MIQFFGFSLKNLTMTAGASAANWCVPGWIYVTTGAPAFDEYIVQYFSQGLPSPTWLIFLICSIVVFCHSNFTSGSASPASCSTGLGLSIAISLGAIALDGATAASTSPRVAHSR